MPQNIYEFIFIFILYAFIGWCVEVAYAAVNKGIFVNRGFLNGPYCPIYGIGVAIVVSLLWKIRDNLIYLYLGSVVLTTLLEYLTGLILEKIFNDKWWDYSDVPFNIGGYVCLKFSIIWGLGCTLIVKEVHPMVYKLIKLVPENFGLIFIVIFSLLFLIDILATIRTVLEFNRRIKVLDELTAKMKIISDEIGKGIFEGVSFVTEKSEDLQEKYKEEILKIKDKNSVTKNYIEEHMEKIKELNILQDKYKETISKKHKGIERILKAFPNVNRNRESEVLEKVKEYIKDITKK